MKVICRTTVNGYLKASTLWTWQSPSGKKLAKAAVAAEVNGEIVQLDTAAGRGDRVRILTFDDEEGKEVVRHTASHVMAQAVLHVLRDKNVKFAIGPAIKNGFYYDFDLMAALPPRIFLPLKRK